MLSDKIQILPSPMKNFLLKWWNSCFDEDILIVNLSLTLMGKTYPKDILRMIIGYCRDLPNFQPLFPLIGAMRRISYRLDRSNLDFGFFLSKDSQLIELAITSKNMEYSKTKEFCEGLKRNQTLQKLTLEVNPLAAEYVTDLLSKALEINATLRYLNLNKNNIPIYEFRDDQTKKLDLSNRGYQDYSVFLIANLLKTNTTVLELNLGGNEIGDSGIAVLSKRLKSNTVLQKLILGSHYFGNKCGDKGAIVLGTLLNKNDQLLELSLSSNKIGDKGTQAIGRALKCNSIIEKIDLNCNQVADAGVEGLVEGLMQNSTVTHLSLINNRFSDVGGQKLAKWLKNNVVLKNLFLNANMMGDVSAEAFANALEINTILEKLTLAGNQYGSDAKKRLSKIKSNHIEINTLLERLTLAGNQYGNDAKKRLSKIKSNRFFKLFSY